MTLTCVVTFGDEHADQTAYRWATRRASLHHGTVLTVDEHAVSPFTAADDASVFVAGSPTRGPGAAAIQDRVVAYAGRSSHPVVVVASVGGQTALVDHSSLPVIAGVPHAMSAWSLLDFAAREATAEGADLALVRVRRDSDWATSMTSRQASGLAERFRAEAERIEEAASYVRGGHPGLTVRTQLRDGTVWDWMCDADSTGRVLVLGTAPEDREGLGAWAVSHLTVPVALVPPGAGLLSSRSMQRSAEPSA